MIKGLKHHFHEVVGFKQNADNNTFDLKEPLSDVSGKIYFLLLLLKIINLIGSVLRYEEI